MRIIRRRGVPCLIPYLALLLIVGLWLVKVFQPSAVATAARRGVAGHVLDDQGEPIVDAQLRLYINREAEPAAETHSQPDGAYLLVLPEEKTVTSVRVEAEHSHFELSVWTPDRDEITNLLEAGTFVTHDIVLERQIVASFWIATVIFIGMLLLIATERLHSTLAVLLAVVLIFGVSLLGGAIMPDLFIFTFEQALEYVDFEVIFLLLGMMIVIGVIEETGIFQWLAYQAYRLSRGRVWLLTVILMTITTIASASLDNVITMLLITPIALEIALVLGINPFSLLVPALLAANVGGTGTLIGTPVNIIIGSYTEFGFNDFLINLMPGVLLGEVGLVFFVLLWYRKDHLSGGQKLSADLIKRLEENGRIRDAAKLRKSGIVFAGLLMLFIFGEPLHLTPDIAALTGAVVMLIWVNPDIEQMMGVVDWTTLMFFIGLFIAVGAIQEVGLLAMLATGISTIVGTNLLAAVLVVVWGSALLSGVVDNIPFAAAMLPVVKLLTHTVPNAENKVLFYALSTGANLGGNSTLIGSSANLVVAGVTERAGYRITFRQFLKVGLPATIVTTAIGCLWLLVHFM
ncbi:MAG: ArsB/NhaD family transporter [Anaerolineae bacterium]|nr:ArsB/NhaD family transporter [Anaerolineae bacterium]